MAIAEPIVTIRHVRLGESIAPTPGADSRSSPLYILDSSSGLGSNQIHRIARDRHSRLWLALPVGLASYDGSFTHQWDRRNGLQCNGLRSVAIGADERVWVGTDLGLELLDGAGRPLSGLIPSNWQFGLCQHIDVSGSNPWIGTAHGLVKLECQEDDQRFRMACPRFLYHS